MFSQYDIPDSLIKATNSVVNKNSIDILNISKKFSDKFGMQVEAKLSQNGKLIGLYQNIGFSEELQNTFKNYPDSRVSETYIVLPVKTWEEIL